MKVLMVSSDSNILNPKSSVRERMREYAKLVDELHIIVLSKASLEPRIEVSSNCFAYPTNSRLKLFRPFDAIRIGKRIDCDLITTQDPFECGWVGLNLKKQKMVPLEIQLHTNPFSRKFDGFLNQVRKFMMGKNFKEASGIRVVLESVGKEIVRRYGVKNVYTLPIFIDRSRISGAPNFDLKDKYGFKKICLIVSRFSKEKNIDLALEAFGMVRSKMKDIGLVVVGSGPETYKEQDGVIFVGWQEDLSSYYLGSDVFIQTSKFEGYGLSLVEAGLSGLSVVTTPVGVANELENISIAHEREDFAKAIEFLLIHPNNELKHELESKILSKDDYLHRLKENWAKLC